MPRQTSTRASLASVASTRYSRVNGMLLEDGTVFSWHPSGEHLVYCLFERYIGISLPKKVPKRKSCQILRKQVICDYLLLLYYSEKIRNFEFNNNKNDLHHDKELKKLHIRHLNRFLFLKWFSSYTMSNTYF